MLDSEAQSVEIIFNRMWDEIIKKQRFSHEDRISNIQINFVIYLEQPETFQDDSVIATLLESEIIKFKGYISVDRSSIIYKILHRKLGPGVPFEKIFEKDKRVQSSQHFQSTSILHQALVTVLHASELKDIPFYTIGTFEIVVNKDKNNNFEKPTFKITYAKDLIKKHWIEIKDLLVIKFRHSISEPTTMGAIINGISIAFNAENIYLERTSKLILALVEKFLNSLKEKGQSKYKQQQYQ